MFECILDALAKLIIVVAYVGVLFLLITLMGIITYAVILVIRGGSWLV
jgi:hypothetical protein